MKAWRLREVNNLPKVAQPMGRRVDMKSKCVPKALFLYQSLSVVAERSHLHALFLFLSLFGLKSTTNMNFKLAQEDWFVWTIHFLQLRVKKKEQREGQDVV